jgi:hypothetical protein
MTATTDTRTFTRNEINLIADALNGCGTLIDASESLWNSHLLGEPSPGSASGLALEISDSISLDQTDEKWGVRRDAILEKIQALSHRETIHLVLTIAKAWDRYQDQAAWDSLLHSLTV